MKEKIKKIIKDPVIVLFVIAIVIILVLVFIHLYDASYLNYWENYADRY